ncbi:unnamed protein product [Mytilus coruscus]|uniref:Uncharacterized protein n=1 Tax=Mytilus coruscus TaxID=42192 RepID=A0A6J8EQ74_MYTCO|nr:unnamed protein product [Mytilus coruscus]
MVLNFQQATGLLIIFYKTRSGLHHLVFEYARGKGTFMEFIDIIVNKDKADQGSSPFHNRLYTGQVIPVGTGLCKQCSIKMSFCKSDNSLVKLNTRIEEDIDLDSQLTFSVNTTELSQQSASDWETDNASDRNNFNQPNKQQKLSNFKTSVKSSMG